MEKLRKVGHKQKKHNWNSSTSGDKLEKKQKNNQVGHNDGTWKNMEKWDKLENKPENTWNSWTPWTN